MDEAAASNRPDTPSTDPGRGSSGTPDLPLGSLGKRIWLVMGGGGLKGLAHIGALRALEERGVEYQGIVGTSIGALVGAIAGAGAGWREMHEMARTLDRSDIIRVNRRAVLFNGIRQVSVFRGDTIREYFASLLPEEGWDALRMPVLVNAVDLGTGHTEWFGPGARMDVSLLDAVYASSALPVFYPPFLDDGKALVDGGTAHPLGLERAETEGATGIIGIDVGSGETAEVETVLGKGMLAVHQRIFSIMTYRRRRDLVAAWDGPPLLYVRPRLEGYATFDFENVEYFVEEGYRATLEALQDVSEAG